MVNYRPGRSTLAGLLIITVIVSLLVGAVVGGLAGFLAASELAPRTQTEPAVAQPVAFTPAETALSEPQTVAPAAAPAPVELQPLAVTEESATVDAVNTVLPAVVTVLSQGPRGTGSGSGFFISSDGYVVTNNHVVEGARNLLVIYAQGGRAPATIVGTAPDFDLAVLKVDGPVPATVEWGDSGELPLGAHVVAIGSALGRYQNTVTAGVLSGFNRELGELQGLLQTDAAINQGNSGGPLINLAGQVVGINTAIVRGGFSAAEGLGFAIPSNVARSVAGRLIESGEVKPPFLGVFYAPLNPQLASEQGLSVTEGALLERIDPGTPAAEAGLRAGDVIVAVAGKPVDDRHPLVSLLLEHVAGERLTLDILRDGAIVQTDLILAERS